MVNSTLVRDARSNQVSARIGMGCGSSCARAECADGAVTGPGRRAEDRTGDSVADRVGHRGGCCGDDGRPRSALKAAPVPSSQASSSWTPHRRRFPALNATRSSADAGRMAECGMIIGRRHFVSGLLAASNGRAAGPAPGSPRSWRRCGRKRSAAASGRKRSTGRSPGCGRTRRCSNSTVIRLRRRRAGSGTARAGFGGAHRRGPAGDAGQRQRPGDHRAALWS